MNDVADGRAATDAPLAAETPGWLYCFDAEAEYVEDLASVGADALRFFAEHGYLAVRRAFSDEMVNAGLAGLQDLIEGKNAEFTGIQLEAKDGRRAEAVDLQDTVRKLMSFVGFDQRLEAFCVFEALLDVLRRLLGDEPQLFQDMALLKPPRGGREKPWHQDKAYFNLAAEARVVGVWIALDEATVANGCMHVLPGTHAEGPVVHFNRRDWQICDASVQVARDVVVPLPPGGCLFFDGLLHHGTPPNHSPKRRRALQFHYTQRRAAWTTPQERLAVYGSEGKDVSC